MKYVQGLCALVLSTGLLTSAQSGAAAQPASHAASWGPPVDGVELQVTIPTDAPQPAADASVPCRRAPSGPLTFSADCGPPRLELHLRNLGTDTVTFTLLALGGFCDVEFDGVWYRPLTVFGNGARNGNLTPGAQTTLRLSFQTDLVALDAKGTRVPARTLNVIPGTHAVRVRTPGAASGLETSTHRMITLVSNLITLNTTDAALRFVTAPADGLNLVQQSLKNPAFIVHAPELADASALQVMPPIALYNLQSPVTTENGQLSVQAAGFEYLVKSSGAGVAAIVVRTDASGRAHVDNVSYGNVAGPEARALDQLTAIDRVRVES